MKTILQATVALIVVASFASCKKVNEAPKNSLVFNGMVFGHFYGECMGEGCIEIFKLETGNLYEDNSDVYPLNEYYVGNYIVQPEESYNKVSFLLNEVPQQLLDSPSGIIGQPDAGDWGGIYLEVKDDGFHKYWLIDKMTTNLPAYLVPFVSKVDSAITLLQ